MSGTIHRSTADDGARHVRITIDGRWIEVEYDADGWAWTPCVGEVCEGRTRAEAAEALLAFAIGGAT